MSDKPPLGCKPPFVVYPSRIIELSNAIYRYADELRELGQVSKIKSWAIEIEEICNLLLTTGLGGAE